jgi:hypothetical protein
MFVALVAARSPFKAASRRQEQADHAISGHLPNTSSLPSTVAQGVVQAGLRSYALAGRTRFISPGYLGVASRRLPSLSQKPSRTISVTDGSLCWSY